MAVIGGGKAVYGAPLGMLILDTRFPRPLGDIGHTATFDFPVQYRVVRGAGPGAVVRGDPTILLGAFVEAGRDLVEMGCDGIAANCGFLSPLQDGLADALGVPVITSALQQVSLVAATLPRRRRVAVLTIAADSLIPAHLSAAEVPEGTPIVGLDPDGPMATTFVGNADTCDLNACAAEMQTAAERMRAEIDDLGAIVLECTNMVPFAADMADQLGLPVFSFRDLVIWFRAGLAPARFDL